MSWKLIGNVTIDSIEVKKMKNEPEGHTASRIRVPRAVVGRKSTPVTFLDVHQVFRLEVRVHLIADHGDDGEDSVQVAVEV